MVSRLIKTPKTSSAVVKENTIVIIRKAEGIESVILILTNNFFELQKSSGSDRFFRSLDLIFRAIVQAKFP